MPKTVEEIYQNVRQMKDVGERLEEPLRLKGWQLIDDRRRAMEGARKLDSYLRLTNVPTRRNLIDILGGIELRVVAIEDESTPVLGGGFLAKAIDTSVHSPDIEKAINSSRYILELGENWDEDGSPSYSEETWNRAASFIKKTAWSFKSERGNWIQPPKITPGPDGSIDVRWKTEKRTLLINFPADEAQFPDFFGSDKGKDTIKGTLDLSSPNQWLLMWLMR